MEKFRISPLAPPPPGICRHFLDAIASPCSYPCQSVSGPLIVSEVAIALTKLCELVSKTFFTSTYEFWYRNLLVSRQENAFQILWAGGQYPQIRQIPTSNLFIDISVFIIIIRKIISTPQLIKLYFPTSFWWKIDFFSASISIFDQTEMKYSFWISLLLPQYSYPSYFKPSTHSM